MSILGKRKKKQLLLVYRLITEEDIVEQTKRFTEINEALDYIRVDGSVYIIKLVPIELRSKLKNFVVNDEKSKRLFAADIVNYHDCSEIWCCKNECSDEMPIYGRFVMDDLCQAIKLIGGNTA